MADECNNWFNCSEKRRNLGMEQVWKLLIEADANDCPALRTTATISGDISVTPAPPSIGGAIDSEIITDSLGSPIPAGALKVMVETSDDFIGTINGIARNASRMYTFEMQGKTLPSIAYTVTGGNMKLDIFT